MSTSPTDGVVIGRAVRPRGLKGELVVRGEPGDLAALAANTRVMLCGDNAPETATWRDVERVSRIKDGVVIKVAGIDDRDAAERWRDTDVAVDGAAFPVPAAGRFHVSQVRGFSVETLAGTVIGVVTGRIASAAHDILTVDDGTVERLIPAVDAIITAVDVDGRRIVIDPPPGLLDLNP